MSADLLSLREKILKLKQERQAIILAITIKGMKFRR